MAKILNFAKVIRRNWKKSILFSGLAVYGASNLTERYQTSRMMRAYCEEARAVGEKVLPEFQKPKHVTVILNPEANDKKSNVQFEQFAAPLLHLAGFKVSIFKTEKEKQAQHLMEIMSNTDAVLVAGGNGTVHEVITGFMRRPDCEEGNLPLGIIPVGRTNTVAHRLFGSKSSTQAQLMAEAAMAVIREETVSIDIMKVKFEEEEKPVFAACSFEQGVFADVEPKVQGYWYLGALKDKFTYFINYFKDHNPPNYEQLQYVAPCSGCSSCYIPQRMQKTIKSGRWWSSFVPKQVTSKSFDVPQYSKILNEDCGKSIPLESSLSNLSIFTSALNQNEKDSKSCLFVKIYPKDLSLKEFFTSGLNHRKSKLEHSNPSTITEARGIKIENEDKSDSSEEIRMQLNCVNAVDNFCYVCGEMTFAAQKRTISPAYKDSLLSLLRYEVHYERWSQAKLFW